MRPGYTIEEARKRVDRSRYYTLAALCVIFAYGLGLYWFLGRPENRAHPDHRGVSVRELKVDSTVAIENEGIAEIERENRAFWSRILRERFGRDVELVVDWGSFLSGSTVAGWPFYPLNIQQAGIERLLYGLTGLMDSDEEFRAAAIDRIESVYIGNAADLSAIDLDYDEGRLAYHCFAGDWNGYYTIDELKQLLKPLIPRRSRLRKMVEGWLEKLSDHNEPGAETAEEPGAETADEPEADTDEPVSSATRLDAQRPSQLEVQPRPSAAGPPSSSNPPLLGETDLGMGEYDAGLRTELESVYNDFLKAVSERDLESLLALTEISRTDEETLRSEMSSDGLLSLSEWMLSVYPPLENTTFLSLKSEDGGLAGYYMAWVPSYSNDYFNLTLIKFEEGDGRWRMSFGTTGPATAIVQVGVDEDARTKVQEEMRTNPVVALTPPEALNRSGAEMVEPGFPEELAPLRDEFDAILRTMYDALERRDRAAFLSTVLVSEEDEQQLRRRFRGLSTEILAYTPEPSQAIPVGLRLRGGNQAGYYFVAPYPRNPSFRFVYLRPFVHRDEGWRMVFSLENDLGVSMNIAKSNGDLTSRAFEVIETITLLDLDWVMTSLFEEIVQRSSRLQR